MVEYAVLAALIAASATLAVTNLGSENRDVFERVTSATGGPVATGGGTPAPIPVPGDNFDIDIGAVALPDAVPGQLWTFDFSSLIALTDPGSVTVPVLSWSGGNPPLPPFLSIDQNGVVSGTPPSTGNFDFEVVASFGPTNGSRVFTMFIGQQQLLATQVASGGHHSCGLTSVGTVFCWGLNSYGQLGDSTTQTRLNPVQVQGLPTNVTQISLGELHSCAVTSSGQLWCWGDNIQAQLGDGTFDERRIPVQVGLNNVSMVSAGGYHTCAVTNDDTAWCWGDVSRVGTSDLPPGYPVMGYVPTPVQVTGSAGITASVVAGEQTSCLLTTNDRLRCWGQGWAGSLGNGTTNYEQTPVPVTIPGDLPVTAVAAYNLHKCAIAGGQVWCWGRNADGELGDGTTTMRTSPTLATQTGIIGTPIAITVGGFHSCAIETGGGLRCWGDNGFGQRGDGSLLSGVAGVSAGGYHTCVRNASNVLSCFGSNADGQLGDGTTTGRSAAAIVQF